MNELTREQVEAQNEIRRLEDRRNLSKKGIVTGGAITTLGATQYGLRKAAEKIDARNIAINAANPKATPLPTSNPAHMKVLKRAAVPMVTAGTALTAYSAYRHYKDKKALSRKEMEE